jgi:hypothetical protein
LTELDHTNPETYTRGGLERRAVHEHLAPRWGADAYELGNVLKYIWRCDPGRPGGRLRDVRKARRNLDFLADRLELEEARQVVSPGIDLDEARAVFSTPADDVAGQAEPDPAAEFCPDCVEEEHCRDCHDADCDGAMTETEHVAVSARSAPGRFPDRAADRTLRRPLDERLAAALKRAASPDVNITDTPSFHERLTEADALEELDLKRRLAVKQSATLHELSEQVAAWIETTVPESHGGPELAGELRRAVFAAAAKVRQGRSVA